MKYRREIDGLRAVAVLPVILFHAGFSIFSGGFAGVDIFFVISGFLITSIIIQDIKEGRFSLTAFYQRRIRRILPALFLVIAVCLPFSWLVMLPRELKDFSGSLVTVPLFISNYYFRKDTGYFAADADEKPLLHTWSLAVEEQYYLLFPAMVWVLWRYCRRLLVPILLTSVAASFAYALRELEIDEEKLFFDTRGRAWEILAGALMAFWVSSSRYRPLPNLANQIIAALGLSAIIYAIIGFDESTRFPSVDTLFPTLGAAAIILTASPDNLVGRLLGNRFFVGIGLISYSAYLWHQPLLAFARIQSLDGLSALSRFAICVASLGLAYLSWKFVETPLRRPDRVRASALCWGAASLSLACVSLGVVGSINKGFPRRFEQSYADFRQKFREENKRRIVSARLGYCHFNGKVGRTSIDEFLSSWSCAEDPSNPTLKKIPAIVVGDSHAADVTMSLRENGYLPVNMSGSGCSVIPYFMGKRCGRQFALVRKFAGENPFYTTIILANRFTRNETSTKAITAMIDYWSAPGRDLVFITSMPEFHEYERAMVRKRKPSVDLTKYELTTQPAVIEILQSRGVKIVDAKALVCDPAGSCPSHAETGEPLTVDGHHLTSTGAKLFGEKLLKTGLIPY
jgi:peptidoglycan/LPS O-acetylase OafA/YrhL